MLDYLISAIENEENLQQRYLQLYREGYMTSLHSNSPKSIVNMYYYHYDPIEKQKQKLQKNFSERYSGMALANFLIFRLQDQLLLNFWRPNVKE